MKTKNLSTALIFSSLSFVSYSFTGIDNFNETNNESFTICVPKEMDDSVSTKVFVCPFISTIDQEVASKIDAFVLKRLGVFSSMTNVETKQISITVNETLGKREVDYIFDTVKRKFLGAEDAPIQHVDCRH